MSKTVAILQSNYIPWKGYFDMINSVDEFILYDDMQYTRRDWRNRNKIKTPHGLQWLTIPVKVKGKFYQKIKETEVTDDDWRNNHWKSITLNYTHAPYFDYYKNDFEKIYLGNTEKMLSNINYNFILKICEILKIKTKISWSSDYILADGKTERLVDLCKQAGATRYISGPAAKDYIVKSFFDDEKIKLEYMNYSNYPEYEQFHPPFVHSVSVLDLIFHTGPDAYKYLLSNNK